MRDLIFTIYKSQTDNLGQPICASWDQWVELFMHHELRQANPASKHSLKAAKNGPAVVFSEIPDTLIRNKTTVVAANALVLDIENHPDKDVETVFNILAPYEYVIWSTFTHGSAVAGGLARIRVVLPLINPVSPPCFEDTWKAFDTFTQHITDPRTKDICRLYFLPATFDVSQAFAARHEGRWLDATELPRPIAIKDVYGDATTDVTVCKTTLLRLRKNNPLMESARLLSEGQPFAVSGDRHQTILKLTLFLASKHPTLSDDVLTALFKPSIALMQEIDSSAPGIDDVLKAFAGAREKLRERIPGGKEPYTPDELARIAGVVGCAVEDLKTRWILQCSGAMFFLTESGAYAGPYVKDDVVLAATRHLARAPIKLMEFSQTGVRRLPITDIACAYGTLAKRIVSDMTIEKTWYDERTQTIMEAVSPLQTHILTPEYNEDIDRWLRLLAGDLYEKLIDWMSVAPDPTKILCAIYFDGVKDSGKTLFAYGMAKLWTQGAPGEIESVLSNFNDELCRCPLVIADEELPKRWHATVTATLRSMLSTTARTLKRKYHPTSELRGAIRLILTANNAFLLDSRDAVSSADLDAIAQRFLYIHVPEEASEFLARMPRSVKEMWGREGIARHALWLQKNHEIKNPGGRFYVEGSIDQMHRLLATGSHWSSMVSEWLVRYLMKPATFDMKCTGLIKLVGGELWVNPQALVDGWNLYLTTRSDPETSKIGAALQAISKPNKTRAVYNGRTIRYHVVIKDHLLAWATRFDIGDLDNLKELLK